MIEVKSTGGDGSAPFPFTDREWRKAVEVHEAGDDRLYIIIRVRRALTKPEILDVILDPVTLWHEGKLQLLNKDLWVRVG